MTYFNGIQSIQRDSQPRISIKKRRISPFSFIFDIGCGAFQNRKFLPTFEIQQQIASYLPNKYLPLVFSKLRMNQTDIKIQPEILVQDDQEAAVPQVNQTTSSKKYFNSFRNYFTKKRIVCCSLSLAFFVLFASFMMTVGVRYIAEYVVAHYYQSEFNIETFEYTSVALGPMNGSTIKVSVAGYMPVQLPVDVRIRSPLFVNIYYIIPFETPVKEFIGTCRLDNDGMFLKKDLGSINSMELLVNMTNYPIFTQFVDHLLYFNRPNETYVTDDGRNYSTPVRMFIDVVVSYIDILSPSGGTLFTIEDVSLSKYLFLRNPVTNSTTQLNSTSITTPGSFFTFLSQLLGGYPDSLSYSSKYMALGNLTLYDSAFGNPPPSQFGLFAPLEQEIKTIGAQSNFTLSPDENSLPFSLDVTFINPTSVSLVNIGNFLVHFNYSDVAIANVSIIDMNLHPFSNTTVTIYGYLKKQKGKEYILQEVVPNKIMEAMTSGIYDPLPFSISGIDLFTNYLNNNTNDDSVADRLPIYNGQFMQLCIQTMLSRRVVNIGNYYDKLGPINDEFPTNITGLSTLFNDFPVLGRNGLGSIVQGTRVHVNGYSLIGRVPISVYLTNPFGCGIKLKSVDLDLYLDPYMDVSLGRINLLNNKDGRNSLVLEPYHGNNMDLLTINNEKLSQKLIDAIKPNFVLKYNIAAFLRMRQTFRQLKHSYDRREMIVGAAMRSVDLLLGRMRLTLSNITHNNMDNMVLVNKQFTTNYGWGGVFYRILWAGWNMVGNSTSAFSK